MVMSSPHKGHKDNFRILSAIKEVKREMRQLFPWKKIWQIPRFSLFIVLFRFSCKS